MSYPSEHFATESAAAAYLDGAFESGDHDHVVGSIGTLVRDYGMTEVAKETGMSRESLYKSLREGGNPEFGTVIRVLKAMGLRFTVRPINQAYGDGGPKS